MRTAAAVCLSMVIATSVAAQANHSEFGRASGGRIELVTKQPRNLSGTLSALLGDAQQGYGATFSGNIAGDRLWFFASAQHQQNAWFRQARMPEIAVANIVNDAAFVKAGANLGSHQTLTGTADVGLQRSPMAFDTAIPSSFLSLRYDAMMTPNTLFSLRVSRSKF